MDYLHYAAMVMLTMALVGVRVSQQLNVTRGYFIRAFFTSYAFTILEGVTVGVFAKTAFSGDWLNLIFLGTGSALGGMVAMFFYHKRGSKQ